MARQIASLEGKVSLVVGASRGIGAAAARAFASAGAAVVLAARDEQALAALAREITETGGRALAVPTDVTDEHAVERLIALTVETYGRLDAAFNNAGGSMTPPTPLSDLSVTDFDRSYAVNVRGTFLALRYEIPAMLAGDGGAIVNMSSTAGLDGVGGLAGYVAMKHGVVGLSKVAALDYAERGIRVNVIAPGPILTGRLAQAGPEAQHQAAQAVPLRRLGRPEEVAAAVIWLCSDAASFITGVTLLIDGGRLAGTPAFRPYDGASRMEREPALTGR